MTAAQVKNPPQTEQRQRWMSILARSNAQELQSFKDQFSEFPTYQTLRHPETGLVMVRARAGGVGQRFNLGEATVTRCSIRFENGDIGHAYIRGRNKQHAELAALFDGLMQNPEWQKTLNDQVVDVIEQRLKDQRAMREAKVSSTKVDFFTMVRGENE